MDIDKPLSRGVRSGSDIGNGIMTSDLVRESAVNSKYAKEVLE